MSQIVAACSLARKDTDWTPGGNWCRGSVVCCLAKQVVTNPWLSVLSVSAVAVDAVDAADVDAVDAVVVVVVVVGLESILPFTGGSKGSSRSMNMPVGTVK